MATSNLSFRDVNITFKKHPVTDDVVVSKDNAAIKQSIISLLLTNRGERLFNSDFGSDIRSFLFEPLDFGTAAQIKMGIRSTIKQYEPRISVQAVVVIPNYDDNGFDVEMTYQIRGTDVPPVQIEFFLSRTR
jgi:phage baseplate assembly protein W|tara:strand:- start:8952 stop:9347 length:396 start_codon:yes stop_codon:yes gene_type:complete